MSDLFYFLTFLYQSIRLRLVVWLLFIVSAALLEGLSVSLFLPIIGDVDGENPITRQITRAIDTVGLEYSLSLVLLLIVVFFVLRSGAMVYQEMYAQRIVTRLLVDLKRNLVEKIFDVDYQYFLRNELGYYTNALTIEYGRVAFAFETCMKLGVAVGFALIYLALPLAINPAVTGAVLLLAIPGYFVLRKTNELTRRYSLAGTEANSHLNSYLIQAFTNFKYLKSTDSWWGIVRKARGAAEEQGRLQYKQSVLSVLMAQSTELLMMCLIVTLLFYNVVVLDLDLVAVLFLLFLLRRAMVFALQAQMNYRKFLGAYGSIRVFRHLETELEQNREPTRGGTAAPDFGKPIQLTDVGFNYNGGERVINSVTLEIPPNRTVALVGESGAGKSTLAALLTGILRPTVGTICLGEVNYRDLDQHQLRRGIGYVTQESVIFNDSVRNNITLWNDDAQDDRIRAAAGKAHLTKFIEDLPDGYDTVMSDAGLNVSGGQRQRINIARELFKDANLLIFDEATSSLDSRVEREIHSNIDEFRGHKTTVVIAHRLSTVKNSDLIFVLRKGEVVENGSYEELYALGGEFTAMVDQQALTPEAGAEC